MVTSFRFGFGKLQLTKIFSLARSIVLITSTLSDIQAHWFSSGIYPPAVLWYNQFAMIVSRLLQPLRIK
jgi:hypothetical protein